MSFANAQNVDASKGSFTDIGQNQYNFYLNQSLSPSLEPLFSISNVISSMAPQVRASQEQIKALTASLDLLLKILDSEHHAGRLSESQTSAPLESLTSLLNEIAQFVEKQTSSEFLKSFLTREDRHAQIESYYHQIETHVASFQISALLNIQDCLSRNEKAKRDDQKALYNRLSDLESNQRRLREMFETQNHSLMEMMISLQRKIEELPRTHREYRFLSHSVQYLSTISGKLIPVESWMITSLDVEFGSEIGSGGYARVFEGRWCKARVALKVLKTEDGITPSPEAIRREIATWSKLSHPHILQFLGANVLGSKPFLVTRYMENGNVRSYIENNPDCNRLKILYDVSLGLVYLHSKKIVHGDLKGLNILIDDAANAVLCDFGLARVIGDMASRTTVANTAAVAGTRNWMAPELLIGGSLRKPCDIYAFGMVIFEIQTNEIPLMALTTVGYNDFVQLIVREDCRPERPEEDEAPQMTDVLWQLAERCWNKDPKARPDVNVVCDNLSRQLGATMTFSGAKPKAFRVPPAPTPVTNIVDADETKIEEPRGKDDDANNEVAKQQKQHANRKEDEFLYDANEHPKQFYVSPASRDSPAPNPMTNIVDVDEMKIEEPQSKDDDAKHEAAKQQENAKRKEDEFLCHANQYPKQFYVCQEESLTLSMACFRLMRDGLKFNICDLETSCLLNCEVDGLSERIDAKVANSLLYSCRFWAFHFRDAISNQHDQDALIRELNEFLDIRLLFWLEVMSLIDEIAAARGALATVAPLIAVVNTKLSDFVQDASQFIIAFHIPMSESTPHIYVSALPFSPVESLVRKHYGLKYPNTLFLLCGREQRWPAYMGRFHGHTDQVNSVVFSPDGKRVASGSNDKTIRIWDVQTGKVVAGPFEGAASVTCVIFSPDGTRVASGSWNGTICIWDAQTGHVVAGPFKGHTSFITSVAFSPDGTRVVSGSRDKTIRIWDAQTGHVVAGPFEGHDPVTSVAFSPDGTRVASGSHDNTIRIWEAQTGQVVADPFEGHTNYVSSVMFSPDGTRVVSGSYDYTIRIWDAQTGHVVAGPFEGHTDHVNSVSFSPDGTRVASGSRDNTIRIWDAQTGQVITGPFVGHRGNVNSVAFSPDGTQVASGSQDKTIRIWDAQTGPVVADPFEGHIAGVLTVTFSPDGTRVASGFNDKTIRIWDAQTGQVVASPLESHNSAIHSVAFSPNGTRIASGSVDSTIRIWDAQTGQVVAGPFAGHSSWVTSVTFSPDGARVASGSFDKTIRIWDSQTGVVVAGPFAGHTSYVSSVMFSPDGTRVASGSWDNTVRVWDAQTGQVVAGPFAGHQDVVASVAISPDGTRVASGSYDYTIRIWDARSGQLVADPFKGHTSLVNSVMFSPDGTRVASGSYDKTIRIWDAKTGQVVVGPFSGHTHDVHSVTFSPDGTRIASGSLDRTIRIWDAQICQDNPCSDDNVHSVPLGGTEVANKSADDMLRTDDISGDNADVARYLHSPYMIGYLDKTLERGWAGSSGTISVKQPGLRFWVPPPYRYGICATETLVIIGEHVVRLDLRRFAYGTSWKQCYSPL